MLDYFRFRWEDVWYSYDCGYGGYEAILEISSTGKCIDWIVDRAHFIMDLSGREKEFLNLLSECNVNEWNGNRYVNYNFMDGVLWDLTLGYSKSINIEAEGSNAFPDTFEIFMKKLHSEWNLPYSKMDSPSFSFWEHRRDAKVEKI